MSDRRDNSFERLYATHADGLLAFLAYQTGDRSLAEDIVADTFERVLTTRSPWRGRSGQTTWLYSIALNGLGDLGCRRGEARVPGPAPTPAGDVGAIADRDTLRQAMQALSGEERAVVALRFGSYLTLDQIADLLEERQSRIESRLYRGLRRLRGQRDAAEQGLLLARPGSNDPALQGAMDRFDDRLPNELRDIAKRLSESRATFSPLELDEMRLRLQRRIRRVPPGRRVVNRLRINPVAGILALGLMLTSGAAVVIAATALGGHASSFGTSFDNTFRDASVHNMRDASSCQSLGPFTKAITIPTARGIITIIIVWDCRYLTAHIESPIAVRWRWGDGAWNSSDGGRAFDNTPSITLSFGNSSYTYPLSWLPT